MEVKRYIEDSKAAELLHCTVEHLETYTTGRPRGKTVHSSVLNKFRRPSSKIGRAEQIAAGADRKLLLGRLKCVVQARSWSADLSR